MKKPLFLKQKNMVRVLHALVPVTLAAIYSFGWRVLALIAVTMIAGFCTEWFMVARRNGKVSYACFVTTALLALSLPPTLPFWMAAVAAGIAILFGKEAFGGFGKNVFNPAIVGRGFVYVCFPVAMTASFVPSFRGFPGGFAHWSWSALHNAPAWLSGAGLALSDAVTAATPLWAQRDYGYSTGLAPLILGHIGTVFPSDGTMLALGAGSAGEVNAVALLLGGAYLLWTRTANWILMVATVAGALSLNVILRYGAGIDLVPPLPFTLFSGALLYAAIFMVTDPVSAPRQKLSQWVYGAVIGALIVFFRYKSIFAGGVLFALLIGNMLAPSLDLWVKRFAAARTRSAAP